MGNARKGFLNLIGVRNKKTPQEVYDKFLPQIVAKLKNMPKGSTQSADFVQRLKDAAADAKADKSPKVALKALMADIDVALKKVDDVSELVISSPVLQDESRERLAEKMGTGAARVEASKHRDLVVAELDKVDLAVSKLNVAVRKLDTDLTGYASPFADDAKTLRARKMSEVASNAFVVAKDLDEGLESGATAQDAYDTQLGLFKSDLATKLTAKTKECTDLIKLINDQIADSSGLAALAAVALADQNREKMLQAYRKKVAQTERMLRQIENWGLVQAPRLRVELTEASPKEPEDIDAAMETLDELQVAITGYRDQASTEYDVKAADCLARLAKVDGEISKSLIAMQFQVDSNWEKAFNKQTTLEKKIIENMIANGKCDKALNAASELIDNLDARSRDLDAHLDEIVAVAELDYQCRQRLKAKAHVTTHPELCDTLEKRRAALAVASRSHAASEVIKDYDTFKKEIWGAPGSLEDLSKTRVVWLRNFTSEAALTQDRITEMFAAMKDDLPAGGAESFLGSLAVDLAAARKLAKSEDQPSMDEAMRELARIKMEANQAKVAFSKKADARTGEEARLCTEILGNQDEAVLAAAQLIKDKATFATSYQRFKEKYQWMKDGPAGEVEFSGELKSIYQMGGNAKDLMMSSEDYPRCAKLLKAAHDRLRKLEKLAKQSPKDLAKINDQWNKALRMMGSQVTKLQTEAKKQASAVGDGPRETAADTIADVINTAASKYLVADAFKDTGAEYARPDLSKADTLRLREKTLKKITLMKEFLSNDPTLRAAQANPFGVKNVVSPVFLALRDIEYKVLVTT